MKTPDPAAVLAHLEEVLTSEIFHNADHARRLLRYVVEQTLAGHGDRLKETTLAIDVFGRDATFDPRTDTIVRTEARRLRLRLDQFYSGEGAALPLRIVLRKGGYVPRFETIADPTSDIRPRASSHAMRWAMAGIAAGLVVIAAVVGTSLSRDVPPPLANRDQALRPVATIDPEAHELYLKGRYYWNRATAADFKVAIGLFQKAIEKDPNFAAAHSSLAACYLVLTSRSSTTKVDALPLARAAAQKAIALDNSLGEAHTALGRVYSLEGDWTAAEAELRQGVALSPSSPVTHWGLSLFYEYLGQLDKALEHQTIARTLDPVAPYHALRLGYLLYVSGRYPESTSEYRKVLELDPNFGLAHLGLGLTLLAQKQYTQGLAATKKGYELLGDVRALSQLGYAHAMSGNSVAARKILEELKARAGRADVPAMTIAQIEMGLGQTDAALHWLSKAVDEREASTLLNNPVFAPLRPAPGYQQLLARLNIKSPPPSAASEP